MNTESTPRIVELIAEITRYLAANPSACDTQEGVRQWWLTGTASTSQDVAAALDHLVRSGSVERVLQHSGTVYRARHAG